MASSKVGRLLRRRHAARVGDDDLCVDSLGPDTDAHGEVADSGLTVSIIIPVFGNPEYTDRCLESLVWSCSDYSLVLVDNSGSYVTTHHTDIFHRPETNLGFAAGCNIGASKCDTDILLFLNNDTLGTNDWLANLMSAFDDKEVVMAGPRIIHPDGLLQTSGIKTYHGGGAAGGEELKDDGPTRDVDGVTGACMAIRREAFEKFGGFDEGFKNGYDDVDLCLQVREAGMRIRYVAESEIIHHESASGAERWAHVYQNIAYMQTKWGSR